MEIFQSTDHFQKRKSDREIKERKTAG